MFGMYAAGPGPIAPDTACAWRDWRAKAGERLRKDADSTAVPMRKRHATQSRGNFCRACPSKIAHCDICTGQARTRSTISNMNHRERLRSDGLEWWKGALFNDLTRQEEILCTSKQGEGHRKCCEAKKNWLTDREKLPAHISLKSK